MSDNLRPPHFLQRDLNVQAKAILQLCYRRDPELPTIADRVCLIPALAELVLQSINSAHVGLTRPIEDAHRAVMLLGPRRIGALLGKVIDGTITVDQISAGQQETSGERLAGPHFSTTPARTRERPEARSA